MSHEPVLVRLRRRLDSEIVRLQKARFRYHLRHVRNRNFTIISRNCIGGLIYQLLGLEYNTPFVGLFLPPVCFIKLTSDLQSYLAERLSFVDESKYPAYAWRSGRDPYPIGMLKDVEVHFMHYRSRIDAESAWYRRLARINFDRLFLISVDLSMTAGCDEEHVRAFDQLPCPRKVCFTAKAYPDVRSAVPIRALAEAQQFVDLYTNYHLFTGSFDFVKWLDA